MDQAERKTTLIAELQSARQGFGIHLGELRQSLDLPNRAKTAILRNPLASISGVTLLGILLGKLPLRRKKVWVTADGKDPKLSPLGKMGWLFQLGKVAFDLARPSLIQWTAERMTTYFNRSKNAPHP